MKREEAIRQWQAKQNYDILQLDQERREKEAERIRILQKCWDYGFDIQGMSFETLEHLAKHQLI